MAVKFNTSRKAGSDAIKGLARFSSTAATTSNASPGNQKFPVLKQIINGTTTSFTFRFPPTNLQYDNMAPEWVEVERPGLAPLVGLRQYRLMRIQFEFLIANSYDGIWYSVEDELLKLRGMANSVYPVYFMYMDKIINQPLTLPGTNRTSSSGAFFRVVEFNINSLRRNLNNEITAAQCSITMQEDFSLSAKAISMPAIEYPPITKPRVSKPKGAPDDPCGLAKDPVQCRRTIEEILAGSSQSLGIG